MLNVTSSNSVNSLMAGNTLSQFKEAHEANKKKAGVFTIHCGRIKYSRTESGVKITPDKKLLGFDENLPSLNLSTLVTLMFSIIVDNETDEELITLAKTYKPKYRVSSPSLTLEGSLREPFYRLRGYVNDCEQADDFKGLYKIFNRVTKEAYNDVIKSKLKENDYCSAPLTCFASGVCFQSLAFMYLRAVTGATSDVTTLVFLTTLTDLVGQGSPLARKHHKELDNKLLCEDTTVDRNAWKKYADKLPEHVVETLEEFKGITLCEFESMTITSRVFETSVLNVGVADDKEIAKVKRLVRKEKEGQSRNYLLQYEAMNYVGMVVPFTMRYRLVPDYIISQYLESIPAVMEKYKLKELESETLGILLYNFCLSFLLERDRVSIAQTVSTPDLYSQIFEGSEASHHENKAINEIKEAYSKTVSELKSKYKELEEEYNSVKDAPSEVEKLKEQLSKLTTKCETLESDLESTEKELHEQRELVEVLMNDDSSETAETAVSVEDMVAYLSTKSIGVFGGRKNWGNALVALLPTIEWYPYISVNHSTVQRLHKRDYVFFNGLGMGHAMSYKFTSDFSDYYTIKNIVGGAVIALEEIYNTVKKAEEADLTNQK